MGTDLGATFVYKWQARFGLWDYHIHIYPIAIYPGKTADGDTLHAASYYDDESLWAAFWLPDDEAHSPETLELVVLHELAHFLYWNIKAEGEKAEEAVELMCDRIARLAKNDFDTPWPEEAKALRLGMKYPEFLDEATTYTVDRRRWLAIVTDALPEDERQVVTMLYWEGLSMRQVAERIGATDFSVVQRLRDKALERMRVYYDTLDREVTNGKAD